MAGQKTEKATPKRRKEQRKQGNVVLSQDIVGAAVLICMFGILKIAGNQYASSLASGIKFFFRSLGQPVNGIQDVKQRFAMVALVSAGVLIPLFVVNIISSVVATMAQTRLLVAPKAAKMSFSKINPINGFKNMFSPKSFVEVIKSIVKIAVIGLIMFNEINANLPQMLSIYNVSVGTSVTWTANLLLNVCFKASIAFLIIGVVDYFFQWWDYERRIKMSKDEIKEEFKNLEGNPETKGRIRSEQRRMARMRQMQAVPSADVVIRNPTHYAIALKYDRNKTKAPVVVAKGQNNVALKIVEIAIASRVHVLENRPLAQALYKTVEVGEEIPEEFYKAVAEVLAYIFRLKKAGRS
ncbi:MAG TPA: flagellar biosynthesis protein FlhB [Ruminiclostridium sp.]|nr:flagellar biosynthesis protein FlhB [Ruminiclostridium sp.]